MIGFAPRLLQNLARVRDNDGVGCNDNGRIAALRIVDFPLVYVLRLFRRRFEHVVERAERVGEVFGKFGGDDVDIC